jgi:NAD(P)-dependent dehydrogenase (short-subunit alcohol dehydrogenase family)
MRVVITGAGRGLGLCLCKEAVIRGWHVLAINRSEPAPELRALIDAGQVSFYQADIANHEMLHSVIEKILQEETSLDGLVNNAGVLIGRESTLETLHMEDMRRSMEINLYAPMELTRGLLPLLRKSPSAGIINISSSAAAIKGTRAIDYPYAISKCAFTMFSEKLRVYLEQDAIRVAAVHPGWMRTSMGGVAAEVEPSEVAVHVLDMLCGKQSITAVPAFVNRFGVPVSDRNEI